MHFLFSCSSTSICLLFGGFKIKYINIKHYKKEVHKCLRENNIGILFKIRFQNIASSNSNIKLFFKTKCANITLFWGKKSMIQNINKATSKNKYRIEGHAI